MEPGTQPHGGRDSGTAAQERSETDGTPRPLGPHSTHNLPHPGYTGESDGMPPDPYASYDFAAFAQNSSLRSAIDSYSAEVYDTTEGDDEILGGNGDDVLVGDRDADWLLGGDGMDLLIGGAGHDRLNGGPGDDVLWGGLGHDHLHGGDGADVFEFSLPVGWEGTVPTFGDDVIYDFDASEGDGLDFSQIYERFPDLSVGVRPTEDGEILITFAHADGTPVGSVTLHRLAYQPIDVFPDPGTPYAPPYEFPEDPGHPVHPRIPSISEFLLPCVDIHAEPVVADVT